LKKGNFFVTVKPANKKSSCVLLKAHLDDDIVVVL
jgi:hypothetical protein